MADASSGSGSSSGEQQEPAEAFTAPGVAVNSASGEAGLDLNGLPTDRAKAAAIEWLEGKGLGHRQVGCGAAFLHSPRLVAVGY